MKPSHALGAQGEKEIVDSVPCPNCGKGLMPLPKNYPLYDVQCTGCSFRAQVKTSNSKPKDTIFGAGWQIIDKVLKSGFMVPPLMANFVWEQDGKRHQEVRFYPFVPKKQLRKYTLSAEARRANYQMFTYTGLNELPHFVLLRR